jgi:RNA polymerase sigma-70 factor (ECF subfamily)
MSQNARGTGVEARLKQDLIALIPRLRRFARALTGGRDEADDLVQAALERALLNLAQWQEGTRLDSWMFRITQNLWFDWLRGHEGRQARFVGLEEAAELPGADGQRDGEARVALQRVLDAIAQLPHEQCAVMALVCVESCSYKEAAEALQIPVGTVMSRLARARVRLHELLGGSRDTD